MKKLLLYGLALGLSLISVQTVFAKGADEDYLKAKTCYGELKVATDKAGSRGAWERCSDLFEKLQEKYPGTEKGAQALFSAAKLRVEMYGRFKKIDDVEAAIKDYNLLIKGYPKSSLADDSLYQIGRLRHDPLKQDDKARNAFAYVIENYPDGDMAAKAKVDLNAIREGKAVPAVTAETKDTAKAVEGAAAGKKASPGGPFDVAIAGPHNGAALVSINVTKGELETAVTVNLSRKAAYSVEYTEEGKRTKSPPELDMLLLYTKPADSLAKDIAVSSPHLEGVKVKKDFLKGGTHLIFEMASSAVYEIDVKGEVITVRFMDKSSRPSLAPKKKADAAGKGRDKPFVVVIDPGHGGSDTGAIGPNGAKEKDVVLSISKNLAVKLKAVPGIKAILTRNDDRTLSLEDRNAAAVAKKSDLFVSIHANAATSRRMSGIETYYLNNATDAAAAKLAKRENESAKKKLSSVEHILSTMLQNYDAAESQVLAGDVQNSLIGNVAKKYRGVKNRRVRSAMFYVLVGAKCPAILVETSFISNPAEEKRLKDKKYQGDVAASIAGGIQKYLKVQDERVVSL